MNAGAGLGGFFLPSRLALWAFTVLAVCIVSGCKKEAPAHLQGYVEGEFVYMAAPAAGMLDALYVKEGDEVTSGAPLFALDATQQRAAVREATMKLEQGQALLADARQGKRPSEIAALEADLKQAQAALGLAMQTFERQKKLYENKTISAQDFDIARSQALQAQEKVVSLQADISTAHQGSREQQIAAADANVKALEATMAKTQWELSQTTQSAPQAALVFDTYFRPGEFVAAGRPVVALLPPDRVRVRVFISETSIGAVQLAASAKITYDGAPAPVSGRVSYISPQAEFTPPVIYSQEMRQKLSFMVEITVDGEAAKNLHPGQPVDVDIAGVVP